MVGQPGNRWMDLLQEAHEKLFSMADSTPEGLTDVEMMGVAGQYDAKDEDDEPVVDLSEAFRHKYSRDIIPVHCRGEGAGMVLVQGCGCGVAVGWLALWWSAGMTCRGGYVMSHSLVPVVSVSRCE